jgi:hypothetical protein
MLGAGRIDESSKLTFWYEDEVNLLQIVQRLAPNVGGVCDVEKANTKLYLKY